MRILITGGAGYVGTSLIPQLLEKNHNVRVFDNLMYGGNQLIPFFKHKNFEFLKGDIRDINAVRKAVKDQDIIIHLAAIVGYPACRKNPILAKEVNVDGAKNVISASSDQLIIYASTGSNYGNVDDVCTEDTPLDPLSLYGQTKTLAERLLLDSRKTIAYRFATGFGVSPRMRLDLLINDFTYKALTEGYLVVYEKFFKRTFIHVRDIGRAFLFALENAEKMRNNVYNVGSESMNYSKEEICNILKKKIDFLVHYDEVGKDVDKRNYEVSYEKIKKLGYKTSISVEQGIDELIPVFNTLDTKKPYSNV
jgi:nucleoside-diphosphate-sugar epimerase